MNIFPLFSKTAKATVRWFIWSLAVAFFFYEFVLRVSPSVMVTSIMATFKTDAGKIGAISAIYYYIYAPMQLPVGLLMDRFGPRYLLPFTAFLCGLGAILFGVAPDLGVLSLGRLMMGFGSAFAFVGLLYLTSHWFPHKRLGLLIGIANSVAMIGAISGEGPISLLEDRIGWHYTMILLGGAGIVLALTLFFVMHNASSAKSSKKEKSSSLKGAWKSFKAVVAHPYSWLNALVSIFLYSTTSGFAALWGVPFLMHNHRLDQDIAGFASSSIFLGWLIGGPILGHFSDRLQRRKPFLVVCSLGGGLALLPVILITNMPTFLLFILLPLVGIFSAAELLNFSYAIDLHAKKATGSAIAFTNFIIMLGGALFQPFAGWMLDILATGTSKQGVNDFSVNDFRIAMICFPLSFFIAFILGIFLKEKKA